ncbi:MAG: aldehyde dehydrogenase family protein, partial [Dermabacteraceae bacterium]
MTPASASASPAATPSPPELGIWRHLMGTAEIGSHVAGQVLPGTGEELELVDPATETVLAGYRDGAEAAVDAAVDAAASAQRVWWGVTASERGRILWGIGAQVREHLEQIARLEARTA